MGALLVVPVLASARVIGRYIRHKVLGLPSFDELPPDEVPAEENPFQPMPRNHPLKTKKHIKVTRLLRR
jgi:hypothetical protein